MRALIGRNPGPELRLRPVVAAPGDHHLRAERHNISMLGARIGQFPRFALRRTVGRQSSVTNGGSACLFAKPDRVIAALPRHR